MWVTNISKGETKALVIGKCNQRDEERKHFSAEETSVWMYWKAKIKTRDWWYKRLFGRRYKVKEKLNINQMTKKAYLIKK